MNENAVHQPPPGAHAMNILRWVLFAFLLGLAIVSITSYLVSRSPGAGSKQGAAEAAYHCPMHPSYTSDRPGECPICGMSLTRIARDEAAHTGPGHTGDVPGLTTVQVSHERIQLIGVRTALVEDAALQGQLDLVGFVEPSESRLRRVQLRVAGWVKKLHVNETGAMVRAGQPLLSIYSPELFQAEQEYLIQRGNDAGAADAAERLRLLGVPDEEIRRLDREGKASTQLVLRAPVSGTVLERGVVEGQHVSAETPLLTIADLSQVWVMADLYEGDIGRVRVGDRAGFVAEGLPGRTFEGRIDFVHPTVSSETRTIKVRLVLANPDGALRPGAYGRVRVAGRGASVLSVPAEAVIETGEHSYVFLARAGGYFEPRMVWTGPARGDRVPIVRGLAAGDTVVASASFLIDSESRLEAAIAGMGTPSGPPHDHGAGQ